MNECLSVDCQDCERDAWLHPVAPKRRKSTPGAARRAAQECNAGSARRAVGSHDLRMMRRIYRIRTIWL
jgi:hypothetical protein